MISRASPQRKAWVIEAALTCLAGHRRIDCLTNLRAEVAVFLVRK